jgi:tetratricopeptide (TPR) repeat protein
LLCSLLLIFIVPVVRAQTPEDYERQLNEALALFDKNRFIEALPLLQHLDEIKPNDPIVKEHLAFVLVAYAASKSDPQEKTKIRLRARKLMLEAKALGDNSNLLRVALDDIPEDGSAAPFSSRKDVDDAMREGEAAFVKADFDTAIAAYQRALVLDPKQYYAALFTGDVYFKMKEMDKAGDWFDRAVSIDPNTETAYRYWGDALAQTQNNTDAIEKYIDAIVAEPYSRKPWTGLNQFAQHAQMTLAQPHIVSPNSLESEGNQTNITINLTTLGKKDGTSNWMMYEMSRATWRGDRFKKEFPDEKEYRHTLKEETEALDLVANMVEEEQKKHKIKNLDPALATLLKLKQEGLIEAYVLISAPDDGIAKDYAAYRSAHRGLIHRYIAEYIASPLRKKP